MRRRAHTVPLRARELPPIHLASDLPPSVPRTMLRRGTWEKVRPGAYVDVTTLDGVAGSLAPAPGLRPDPADRARALALARISAVVEQARRRGPDATLVRSSAAMLHGFDLWRIPTTTQVARTAMPGAGRGADVSLHTAPLSEDDVGAVSDALTTNVVRTVVDLARFGTFLDGLVVVDRALRAGIPAELLGTTLARFGTRRGTRRARELLEIADDGAESPWESCTRLHAWALGLPRPVTQLEIVTDSGVFYADLAWPELRLVVEFDGLSKYGRLARGDGSDVVVQEKIREDALRASGWTVVRVTASNLRSPGVFEHRLRRALPTSAQRALRPRPHLLLP